MLTQSLPGDTEQPFTVALPKGLDRRFVAGGKSWSNKFVASSMLAIISLGKRGLLVIMVDILPYWQEA